MRFIPGLFVPRAIAFGVLALMIPLPLITGLLMCFGEFQLSFAELLLFKTASGGLIGLVFTPVIVLATMADKGGSAMSSGSK